MRNLKRKKNIAKDIFEMKIGYRAIVAISYKNVYDDFESINPADLIKDVPTIPLLYFLVELHTKVFYHFGVIKEQYKMIRDMCYYLDVKAKRRVNKFLEEQKYPMLIDCQNVFILFQIALANYEPCDPEYFDDELDNEEKEKVYKALLYSNQLWIENQNKGIGECINKNDLVGMSLLIELPYIEFKFAKDFKTQLYKSASFFQFCEKDPLYSIFLPSFCSDFGVEKWQDYFIQLFNVFYSSLNEPIISVEEKFVYVKCFLENFCIDVHSPELQINYQKDPLLKYFRNKFILPCSENKYLLLNKNLLVDKFYQGMRFDFFNSLLKHEHKNENGKLYKSYPDFSQEIGEKFTENELLYSLLSKCYDGKADAVISGNEIKDSDIIGEPDFYIREGKYLYLFECKDLTLGDKIKFSRNASFIKEEILNRLCCDKTNEAGKHIVKGVGQLLYNVDRILNHNLMKDLDSEADKIKIVFPIIVATDNVFNAIGVNWLITDGFSNLLQKYTFSGNITIASPVILQIDTLINISYALYKHKELLAQIILDYINNNKEQFPLSEFVSYNFKQEQSMEETAFLFGDLLTSVTEDNVNNKQIFS